jgi:hypothetical protein
MLMAQHLKSATNLHLGGDDGKASNNERRLLAHHDRRRNKPLVKVSSHHLPHLEMSR